MRDNNPEPARSAAADLEELSHFAPGTNASVDEPKVTQKSPPVDVRQLVVLSYDWFHRATSAITNIVIPIIAVLFLFATYKEIRKQPIIIEPFEVPDSLKEHGYSGKVVAVKFIDQINYIKAAAFTSMQGEQFTASWEAVESEIQVPDDNLLLESIAQYLRYHFGKDAVRILGEIIVRDDMLYITTRVSGQPAKTVKGPVDELDKLLLQSAEHIYLSRQPYILASYYFDIDKARSLKTIHHIVRSPPDDDDAWAYNLWGLMLFTEQDYENAIRKYERAAQLDTKYAGAAVHAYHNWGLALADQGNQDAEAIAKYQQALKLDSTYANAYISWGLIIEGWGDLTGAIAKYQQAIEMDPKAVDAYLNLGIALHAQEDYAGAITQYEHVTALAPQNLQAYINWGRALADQSDYDGAIAKYRQAIELEPTAIDVYFNWGNTLYEQGDYAGAIAKFQDILAQEPQNIDAHFNIAHILDELGKHSEAIAQYEKIIAFDADGEGAMAAKDAIYDIQKLQEAMESD